jgi:hypothetical protein
MHASHTAMACKCSISLPRVTSLALHAPAHSLAIDLLVEVDVLADDRGGVSAHLKPHTVAGATRVKRTPRRATPLANATTTAPENLLNTRPSTY